MNARDALTARIRFLNERITKLQDELALSRSERATVIAERDALTPADEVKVESLRRAGVVKVES